MRLGYLHEHYERRKYARSISPFQSERLSTLRRHMQHVSVRVIVPRRSPFTPLALQTVDA